MFPNDCVKKQTKKPVQYSLQRPVQSTWCRSQLKSTQSSELFTAYCDHYCMLKTICKKQMKGRVGKTAHIIQCKQTFLRVACYIIVA